MPQIPLVILAACSFAALTAAAVTAFIVIREWWWNRDRGRRVSAMLHQEREHSDGGAFLAGAMAVQLAEIRALPEVLGPLRP
jgi:hypothetical protein